MEKPQVTLSSLSSTPRTKGSDDTTALGGYSCLGPGPLTWSKDETYVGASAEDVERTAEGPRVPTVRKSEGVGVGPGEEDPFSQGRGAVTQGPARPRHDNTFSRDLVVGPGTSVQSGGDGVTKDGPRPPPDPCLGGGREGVGRETLLLQRKVGSLPRSPLPP